MNKQTQKNNLKNLEKNFKNTYKEEYKISYWAYLLQVPPKTPFSSPIAPITSAMDFLEHMQEHKAP